MKINFLGDSITRGAGAETPADSYVEVVGQLLGCEVCNYGISGTRIARQRKLNNDYTDEDFLQRAQTMAAADFVFVFGGTNDYGHGDAEMGELDSLDTYTFCGAVNTLIDYLLQQYSKQRICFILPLHRYNEDNPYGEGNKEQPGATLQEYVEKLTCILQKKEISYLDFFEEFPIPTTNAGDQYTIDGLHPNNYGHKIIADKIAMYIKEMF